MRQRIYLCIDLKSFYASVECVERKLDPMTANLVVADVSRTEKTICLAVSPSLKSYGIPGRPRLFEVEKKVNDINALRIIRAPGKQFAGESYDSEELKLKSELKLSYIIAKPRMSLYIEYSKEIYGIYIKHVSPEDIHVYSVDEVFMDITDYFGSKNLTARQMAMQMIHEVYEQTGITATAGIGTNLYLAKIAMDIVAKHTQPDKDGVRIAELDEMSYRRQLWTHTPITDFWRVGAGYARKLEKYGLLTMGDIAECSVGKPNEIFNEDLLYKLFGIYAELLIDHAWGWEPCTISDIKAYKPATNSLSMGQVLSCPYDFDKARVVVREMIESLVLDMVEKNVVTDQISLTIAYDRENITDISKTQNYSGQRAADRYGRIVPKPAHGTANLPERSSSTRQITETTMDLYDRITDRKLSIRKISIAVCRLKNAKDYENVFYEQTDLFTDYDEIQKRKEVFRTRKKTAEGNAGNKEKAW